MDQPEHQITFNKPEELGRAEDKIADLLAEAIYNYLVRKGLRKVPPAAESGEKSLDK